jgi:hypothetical protein
MIALKKQKVKAIKVISNGLFLELWITKGKINVL